jgi:phage shock protein A
MTITINQLIEEKKILEKDFDELNKKVKTVEVELMQMKGNLNALNGAIQQTDKFIRMAQESTEKK